ncbi:AAA family ATPase [Hydrogenimonas urashimensis]|uniref:AAA family ATPase n=1 Tax=Hydrogenimonas urashimensis TaxID=2740515 RepID=UPI001914F664|nr:AAA family ATPase [Hydrogenimonas urashimensis]
MRKTNVSLKNSDKYICDNIKRIKPDDIDFYSSNIFKGLRDFTENVVVKLSGEEYYSHDIFNNVKGKVFSNGKYKFLKDFHQLLQKSMSHYTEVGENATRLIFKYYEYLLKIKTLMKNEFDLDLLSGLEIIEDFINEDKDLKEYYEKIANVISTPTIFRKSLDYSDVYYVDRVKPFFINQKIFYEVTFRIANDFTSKFDRMIAFTNIELISNYALKFAIVENTIELYDKIIPIKIITDYEVSIRPCEFKNLSQIIFGRYNNFSRNNEYKNLMRYMKNNNLNLLDIIYLSEEKYIQFKIDLANNAKTSNIRDLLDKYREIVLPKLPGSNILRYLLYVMNNNIIKKQFWSKPNNKLSDLYLKNSVIPFDKIPYSFFPPKHTPRIVELFKCIDSENREDELLARLIRNNSEIRGMLYTNKKDIKTFKNIDELIKKYNVKLYHAHKPDAELKEDRRQIYLHGYEKNVIEIIEKINNLSKKGLKGYSEAVKSWLEEKGGFVDDPIKKEALIDMFENSTVSLVYGSAGTGKTKLIEYITLFFKDRTKDYSILFLANTHTAVNNLRRRVGNVSNSTFGTVKKYSQEEFTIDILIIDECSTISNIDMLNILKKINFKLLVLVGDIYQIDSIRFGNWFYLLNKFFPHLVVELQETRRTKNTELLDFWNAVRNLENTIEERISRNNFATSLDNTIFESSDTDEIILCLNYNGLYGINNINMLLQQSNPKPEEKWGIYAFKIGDPILFNEIGRRSFGGVLYNNLKGIIKDISFEYNQETGEKIKIFFTVEIEDVLTEFDVAGTDVELIEPKENSSIIKFYVNKFASADEDSSELKDDIIPFQIAYALSIHKSQGLEYNSVKIVITDEVEEQISHNIFYTAITRSKEKLKIYWSPQTQKKILETITHKFNDKDFNILKSKINTY